MEGHHYGEQNIGREHGEDSMPVQVEAEEDVEMVGGAGVGVVGTKPERREKTTERNPC